MAKWREEVATYSEAAVRARLSSDPQERNTTDKYRETLTLMCSPQVKADRGEIDTTGDAAINAASLKQKHIPTRKQYS